MPALATIGIGVSGIVLLLLIVTGFTEAWTEWQFIGAVAILVAGMAAWDRFVIGPTRPR